MLPLPNVQGADEYRIYFNERQEKREVTEDDEVLEVDVTVYDYASVLSDHEPTDEEWREVLVGQGFASTKVTKILKG